MNEMYETPEIEITEVNVEKGFSQSLVGGNNNPLVEEDE